MKPTIVVLFLSLLVTSVPAFAQSDRPEPAAEIRVGYAGFLDEGIIPHTVLGGAGRFYFAQRLAVGPEFVYMWGPDFDRDSVLSGILTWDLVRDSRSNPRTVTPYLAGGLGILRHSQRFESYVYATVTAGWGVRVRINDRLYTLGDFRLGWEAHYRVTGGIGVRLSK